MTRVPISFYLNILAGLLVLFHHYASSETGDVALNKVTGAVDRFSALFCDTAAQLEMAFCHHDAPGPGAVDTVLPHDVAAYLRRRYCGTSNEERVWPQSQPHGDGGYGGSESSFPYALAYHQYWQAPISLVTSPPPVALRVPGQSQTFARRLSKTLWDRSYEATVTIGALVLRTCVSYWWFRAPLHVTCVLFASYAALWTLGYFCLDVFGTNGVPLHFAISQVYLVAVVDFLQCIQWEAQRLLISDVGVVVMMPRAYGAVKYVRTRMQRLVGI